MKVSNLGEPDIRLAGLRIWIHNRQFPDAQDYWDGNWINAIAEFTATGAIVKVEAPFIHLGDLSYWLETLTALQSSLKGEANYEPMEPELKIGMAADALGHIIVNLEITPDIISQKHWFEFDIDQSYLSPLVSDLESVLKKFPLRGKKP